MRTNYASLFTQMTDPGKLFTQIESTDRLRDIAVAADSCCQKFQYARERLLTALLLMPPLRRRQHVPAWRTSILPAPFAQRGRVVRQSEAALPRVLSFIDPLPLAYGDLLLLPTLSSMRPTVREK
jgi:hypothetical protein